MKIKTSITCLAASILFSGFAIGGTPVNYGSSAPSSTLFGTETTISGFAMYLKPDAILSEDTWGGGLAVEHFFGPYVGLAGSAAWADPGPGDLWHNYVGDLIIRLPIESLQLAPYALAGVGTIYEEDFNLLGRAGAGIDLRFNESFGIFTDWIYYVPDGGAGSEDGENYSTVRIGAKIAF